MTETEMIAAKLGEVAESMQEMAAAFTLSIENDRLGRRRWYLFVTAALFVIAFGVFHYGTTLIDAANTSHKIAAHQLDCSVPGGQCYEKKQASSRQATADIVAGVDADLRGLVQSVCNLDPRQCPAGFHPAPSTTTTTVPPSPSKP
jgi:hypothetical protein